MHVLGSSCNCIVHNVDTHICQFICLHPASNRRRVGNTGKMGALFGILYAIGAPVPQPGSFTFMIGQLFVKIKNIVSGERPSVVRVLGLLVGKQVVSVWQQFYGLHS